VWDEEEICAENYHLSFYIITLGAFVIVDHSGMEDKVHNQPKNMTLITTSLPVAHWFELRKVMAS